MENVNPFKISGIKKFFVFYCFVITITVFLFPEGWIHDLCLFNVQIVPFLSWFGAFVCVCYTVNIGLV